jgi:hypothetical protein
MPADAGSDARMAFEISFEPLSLTIVSDPPLRWMMDPACATSARHYRAESQRVFGRRHGLDRCCGNLT